MGKVYLIGAGPGDEDLITLKAVKALKKCTAVMYDRLAGSGILNYLNEDCEIYYCGKEPGCHYKSQDEINNMLVELAKKGHTVGRIKGGDPYVFGRGGEEALTLLDENIEFEVIPGVTSAISVLNYGGIPITHRGLSQGFHVMTGKSAKELNHRWDALAKLPETLVFLMGFKSLPMIVKNLIANGKSKNTPCGVIMRGTTALQKKAIGTLETIEEKVREVGISSPCIIIVGDVVTLNDKLNWYERKPLFGINLCITRGKEQSSILKEDLKELGAEVREINSIKIEPTKENLKTYIDSLKEYDYIVLTSVNGVNIFFDYLMENNYDIRNIKGKFASVGKATSKALRSRGIVPSYEAKEFVGEGLLKVLEPAIKKEDKILIPCSSASRDLLKSKLEEKGATVHKVSIYDTVLGEGGDLSQFERINGVIFTSPSTVKNMVKLLGKDAFLNKKNIAIGPVTLKELQANGIDAVVCKEHSIDGLIDKVKELWGDNNA